jgi:microcystin-dependent protein
MRTVLALCALTAAFSLATAAPAATTGQTGGGVPFDNRQPYLAVSQMITTFGTFPSRGDDPPTPGFASHHLGMLRTFGGNFAIGHNRLAQGQIIPIASNTALFSLIGTFYGGDGKTTFALPNLDGRTIIGAGQGVGLTERFLGEQVGEVFTTLTDAQMPVHTHGINVAPGSTGPAGGNQPFSNMQPSLGMTYMIATGGIFQSQNPFIGKVAAFGGNFAPSGWVQADGRLLRIDEFDALFQLIGTTYGGDGQEFFAVPDLRGRAIVGAGGQYQIGQTFGDEQRILTLQQLPSHDHDGGAIEVDPAGDNQAFDNRQPSLALKYFISRTGLFPPQNDPAEVNTAEPYIGEIVASAADQEPNGYFLADGRLLPIAQNQALFALLGTTYGGDGRVTFALPDLRDRVTVGWGANTPFGDKGGIAALQLTVANLPPHAHALPDLPPAIPEPATWAMMIAGFALAGAAVRRRQPVLA